ncbi:MAG: ATP-binding cassette domain-containing protein, partial [Bacteroidota bacterium]
MIEIDIHLPRRNFDLKIQEQFGSGITGVFGPSGAGKTSLLQAIAGLAKPSRGRIQVGGRILFDSVEKINLPVEKRNIAYVFQDGRLFPHLNVESNLKYGLNKKKEGPISFKEVVDLLQLSHLLKSKPAQISGGERQRTALGRALLSSPDLLLLDEPFSAVDMQLRQQILHFILKVQQRTNLPISVVSHDLPDLLKLSKKLCIIKEGACLAHADYYDLLKDQQAAQL